MAEKKKAQSRGRPTKYKKEYAEQARKLCLLGATDAELADFFEVDERTINRWKNEFPEFSQSIKDGKITADANVADRLYQRAIGYDAPDEKHYPPDPTSMIFWLKNRRPQTWRDKPEVAEQNEEVAPVKVVVEVKDARKPDADA